MAVSAAPLSERPMRADARRNRDALLAAARELFAERGGDLAMEDIARRAGVGVGTLYRHFPKRIDVVEAVYSQDVEGLVGLVAEVSQLPDSWAALTRWLQAFVSYVKIKRTFLTELHEAFEANPEFRSRSRERLAGALGAVVTRAQREGTARADIDAEDVMQLVGGMCLSATTQPGQNERLLAVLLDGLRAPANQSADNA